MLSVMAFNQVLLNRKSTLLTRERSLRFTYFPIHATDTSVAWQLFH